MIKRTTKERLIASVKRSKDEVFLRKDLDKLGDYRQVSRAIREIVNDGVLVRVGYGVYVRARPSTISGKPVPVSPLIKIGLETMRKLGIKADVGKEARDLRERRSTQVPMLPIISVGNSRVSRKIQVGNKSIVYETN